MRERVDRDRHLVMGGEWEGTGEKGWDGRTRDKKMAKRADNLFMSVA